MNMIKKNILHLWICFELLLLIVVLVVGLTKVMGHSPSDEGAESGKTEVFQESQTVEKEETSEKQNIVVETEETDPIPLYDLEEPLAFDNNVQQMLDKMSVEDKVAQLFMTTAQQITGYDVVTAAGERTYEILEYYPIGGIVYLSENLVDQGQMKEMLNNTKSFAKELSGIKIFRAIAENGGKNYSPVAKAGAYTAMKTPATYAESGNINEFSKAANDKAKYLADTGFNMIIGPMGDVADESSDRHDAISFGSDSVLAGDFVAEEIVAMHQNKIESTITSFPGVSKVQEDYSVYQRAIDAGARCIMVSNLNAKDLTGKNTDLYSLIPETTAILRTNMGFDGIIITDNLSQKAVTQNYSVEEAAVKAINSGKDMIYVTNHFEECYDAVLDAVNTGAISKKKLNNAVGRILTVKMN